MNHMTVTAIDYHFNILTQLLQIVTSNEVGRTGFSLRTDTDDPSTVSLQERFLAGVLDGSIRSDEEAALKLYDTTPADQRYLTLRTRCIDRLLNAIRHIDFSYAQLSEYSSNYFKCLDLVRVSSLLALYGNATLADYSLSRALTIARKYHFTELEFVVRKHLSNSALLSWDVNSNKAHHKASFDLIRTLIYEHFSIATYDSLYLISENYEYVPLSVGEPTQLNRPDALTILDDIDSDIRSHTVIVNHLRARIDYYKSICEYESAFNTINELLHYYNDNGHLQQNSKLGELQIQRIETQFRSRRLICSEEVTNPSTYFHVGKTNWCIATIYTAFKYLYVGDYYHAYRTYRELIEHYSDRVYPADVYENRMLLEAYIWLMTSLLPAERFDHADPVSTVPFRTSTFLNSISILASNKFGSNALIVIVHTFILLVENKHAEAFRRISYLNVYATRYLKGEAEQRLWYCVKAMQKIPTYRTRPHMMRAAMESSLMRIRRLSDIPMTSGINELVQWDALLEAYIDWEERQARRGGA